MTTFPDQDRPAFWQRLFFAIPVLGWIARDIAKDASNGVYAAVAFLAGWGCATLIFGYAGFIIPALALVPTVFILLIVITRG